ncbi:bifunctional nicotinamidase/pyrazinamidase [Klebsiella sp. BIGb0407]|uniref:bifunctional nicotinamidase/pyrazinamidase n=1 Tax=Klebsiella sp. BIGb0407 TaxID=2940603 RepID=UPI002169E006|nr:bifunctional nicotinamidase/pyrazinamidase [Klebsiella sp. BIGb0407]MCS3429520.1 nicotinamidase/pyrazinamidase [Klebsiella sp. BIGb0407]
MSQQALLLVDLQNDFCAGGSLEVPEGSQTVSVANHMISLFQLLESKIVATQDWHPADHGSFASVQNSVPYQQGTLAGLTQTWWPDHCIQQSHGAEFHPQLNIETADHVTQKGCQPEIDSYSAFFDNGHRHDTGLDNWLRQQDVSTLVIMGLATDYCVKYTVLDALNLGYNVTVITDGCRGVNLQPSDSEQALQDMALAGARLMTSAEFGAETQH